MLLPASYTLNLEYISGEIWFFLLSSPEGDVDEDLILEYGDGNDVCDENYGVSTIGFT